MTSEPLDGLIVLNKPPGVTSAKALYKVRAITRQRKSGHAGTLDPAATGVLLICLGRATKLVERLMNLPKAYVAEARLDITSDSFDLDEPVRDVTVHAAPSASEVAAAFASLVGRVEQVPPAFSAIKVGGRAAYKDARKGIMPDLKPRPVRIDAIEVRQYAWPVVSFELHCGRGTYLRSLIRDVGERLGTGGCLTRLCRTAVGSFTLQSAWTIDGLKSLADVRTAVLPTAEVAALLTEPGNQD